LAYHIAGRHDEELAETRRRRAREPRWLPAMTEEGRAFIALGRSAELLRVTADISSLPAQRPYTVGFALHLLAQEAHAHGRREDEIAILAQFDEWIERQVPEVQRSAESRRLLGIARYQQGRWVDADSILSELLRESPSDATLLGWVGATAAQRGDTARASGLSARLAQLDRPYLFGSHSIGRARIAAVLGDRGAAIALTRQALSEGLWFTAIHLLPELLALRTEPEFDALVRIVG
jgi:hypothetical protein